MEYNTYVKYFLSKSISILNHYKRGNAHARMKVAAVQGIMPLLFFTDKL